MGIDEIKKIGLCIICGIKPSKKEGLSDKGMCKVCDHLADEKFYEIPNKYLARKYFKDYLGKTPTKEERDDIDKLFDERPVDKYIHGIMPSKCPFCENMATNKGQIQSYKIGSKQHEKVIINGSLPTLVCKACGDFSLYLSHIYRFSREDSVKLLKIVSKMKKDNKESGKLVCQTCAAECGFIDPEYTEEEKEFVKKAGRKILCKECISRLKQNAKRITTSIQERKRD